MGDKSLQNSPVVKAEEHKKIKIALLGGGNRAAKLLSLFCELDDVEVVALADGDTIGPGMAQATKHDIPTLHNCHELETLDVDVIIEATSNSEMHACLSRCRPARAEIISEQSALLMWRLLEAGKRGREHEKLLSQLSEVYDQISQREQELKKNRAHMERANRELERGLAETFFIHEFFKALTSFSSSVEDTANLIADGGNGILGVELSCVYLLENETHLRLKGFQGRTREEFKETITIGEELVGRCAQNQRLISNQDPDDPGPLAGFLVDEHVLKTQAAVPLMVRNKLLGVLAIGQTTDRLFTERELSRTESIGHMSSLAMQNAISNSALERLSVTDRLTELYNHGYFQHRLEEEISLAKRKNLQLALVMLDIDHFKDFNDNFGHPKGDQVLKRVGAILTEISRAEDTVARYGGEEFVIVLPGTGKRDAAALAERIRVKVASEAFAGDRSHPLVRKTVSIGVAAFPEDARVQADLIDKADKALYQAKRSGRNQVIVFPSE